MDKKICGCVESDFEPIVRSDSPCAILLECGDYILQETECKILQE